MQKKAISKLISLTIILIFFLISYFFKSSPDTPARHPQISDTQAPEATTESEAESTALYEVTEVIDGDTLWVKIGDKSEKIRLLQINAPEISNPNIPMGKPAAEFARNFLEGKKVILEYDKEPRDQYGRLLCYVSVLDDSGNRICLNEELIRNGMAKVVRYGSNVLHYDDYKKLEQEAKQQNLGIWQDIEANYPKKKESPK